MSIMLGKKVDRQLEMRDDFPITEVKEDENRKVKDFVLIIRKEGSPQKAVDAEVMGEGSASEQSAA